jgi:hypothetical protein
VFEHSLSFYLLFALDASQEAIKIQLEDQQTNAARSFAECLCQDLNIHYFSGTDCFVEFDILHFY